MNQGDRQLIADLFDRMHAVEGLDKDDDAEAFIHQSMRQNPDSPYLLVQSVLAQEVALQKAEARIRELEGQVGHMSGRTVPRGSAVVSDDERAPWEAPKPPASGASRSVWRAPIGGAMALPAASTVPRSSAVPAAGRRRGGAGQGQSSGQRGGGFMAQAMTTAAGVAGGMLLASGISSLFSGGESAATDTASRDALARDTGGANAAPEESHQEFADSLEQGDTQQASHEEQWGGGDDWGEDFDI